MKNINLYILVFTLVVLAYSIGRSNTLVEGTNKTISTTPTKENIKLPEITPTPSPTESPQASSVIMPSWCTSLIQIMNDTYKPMNYSQGAINELIKKRSPECATY